MTPEIPELDRPDDDLRFVTELRAALSTASAADTIGATTSPDRLLDMVVRAAARSIPCPEGALLLVDQDRQALTFEVVIGATSATVKELTVPLGHGIAGLVAVSGQALAIANAQEDPRHARDVAAKSGYLPTTILAVPVVSTDGTVTGVLELLDRQGQATFDLADMEALGGYAEQLALVLELRRGHDSLAARLGAALATVGGLAPDAAERLNRTAAVFADRVGADPEARRTGELAELVVAIAGRGQAEQETCLAVLRAFADYLDATPSLGMGMFG